MDDRTTQLEHLTQLAGALVDADVTTELKAQASRPYLRVANAVTPSMHERVYCNPGHDGEWAFCWQWGQEIGSTAQVTTVAATIVSVLRPVAS